jgi:hypothetical protein
MSHPDILLPALHPHRAKNGVYGKARSAAGFIFTPGKTNIIIYEKTDLCPSP